MRIPVCRALLGLTLAAILFVACSGNTPEINFIEMYPVRILNPATDQYRWELFVFGQVFDEDGFSDLEEMYIADSDDYIYWTVAKDDWVVQEMNDENWIALPRLSVTQPESLRGEYRAILVDAAGAQTEREYTIPQAPEEEEQIQPAIAYNPEDGTIKISSLHSEHRVFAYSASGRKLGSLDTTEPSVELARITNERTDVQLFVGTLTPYKGYLYRTGPVTVP